MVYLPTFTIKNQPNVGNYAGPMDGMGKAASCGASLNHIFWLNLLKRLPKEEGASEQPKLFSCLKRRWRFRVESGILLLF